MQSGHYVSTTGIILLCLLFAGSLTAVGLLVHFLGSPAYVDSSAASATTPGTGDSSTVAPPKINLRLPRSVLPLEYNVRMWPRLDDFSLIGSVDMLVTCAEDTTSITFHANDMNITESSIKVLNVATNTELSVSGVEQVEEANFFTIKTDQLVSGQNYRITLDYIGHLNNDLVGFYRSSYTDDNGQTKYLATTQMEATDARRAFPCFDEPNMKAKFTIALRRNKNLSAASNMASEKVEPIEGTDDVWETFKQSPDMSTYLIAMLVSDFIGLESDSSLSPGVKFTIWARKSAESQMAYAQWAGPTCLNFYNSWFNISFPLEKQDMAAIPDFSAGAMENWGLVTYRESALLFDNVSSGAVAKQRVAVVIAHELAHQWFGDLVTMDWWDGLWLNEGFATYMEFIGTDALEPSFEMMKQYVTEDTHHVFGIDALESSHPIYVDVQTPDEINEIFDSISYEKGACLMRMCAGFMGPDVFQRGLHRYLSDRAYGNAVQDDLWQALTTQAQQEGVNLPATIKEIMDTWTLRMGFPVIDVTRNYGQNSVTVSQERFLLYKNPNSTDPTVYRWWVPLTYTSNFSQPQSEDWIRPNESSKTLHNIHLPNSQWMIFNVEEMGYYRVNYDEENWNLITNQLNADLEKIMDVNRAQIMDDSLNLARANRLRYDIALNLTKYLKNERSYFPWHAALNSLGFIESMLLRSAAYGSYKHYMSDLILPFYNSLGFQDTNSDPHLTTYNRISAVETACRLDMSDCVTNSVALYAKWMANPTDDTIISPNTKPHIGCTAVRKGGEEEWNFAYQKYLTTNVAADKETLLYAMSCTEQVWILSQMLEWCLDESSGIRKQDGSSLFSDVANNPVGRYIAFDFVRNRWTEIKNYYPGWTATSRIIKTISNSFNTKLDLRQLVEFRDAHANDLGTATRSVDQAIENVQANIAWMETHFEEVVNWLNENKPSAKRF